MHTNVRLANGTWNNSQGKADGALGLGLKLGGLWKLTNNLDLGAAIGTPVAYEKFKRYDNLFPLRSNEAWNGTIGLAYKIMPSTTITLDVEGELLHRAKFYGASPAIGGSGLKNAYNYEFGIQHTFNPCLTGRVGYNYGPTPIGNNIVHNSVFDDAVVLTEHMVGTGLTYSLNKKIDLDFALNYFFKKTLTDDGSLTAGASNGLRLSGRVLSLMFGFNYKY
jgi:long-chain fatty acid transport protein